MDTTVTLESTGVGLGLGSDRTILDVGSLDPGAIGASLKSVSSLILGQEGLWELA